MSDSDSWSAPVLTKVVMYQYNFEAQNQRGFKATDINEDVNITVYREFYCQADNMQYFGIQLGLFSFVDKTYKYTKCDI